MRPSAMSSTTMQATAWNQGAAIVRLQEEDAGRGEWDNARFAVRLSPYASVAGFVTKTLAITELEVRKLRHDFTELITRAAQPVLWFVLFGEVLTRARAIPTGEVAYRD